MRRLTNCIHVRLAIKSSGAFLFIPLSIGSQNLGCLGIRCQNLFGAFRLGVPAHNNKKGHLG